MSMDTWAYAHRHSQTASLYFYRAPKPKWTWYTVVMTGQNYIRETISNSDAEIFQYWQLSQPLSPPVSFRLIHLPYFTCCHTTYKIGKTNKHYWSFTQKKAGHHLDRHDKGQVKFISSIHYLSVWVYVCVCVNTGFLILFVSFKKSDEYGRWWHV